jgi:hypothetical protein
MKPKLKWAGVALGGGAIIAAAFVGGRASASGIPAAGALTYSGLLQDAAGTPLMGTQYVEVKLWNDATATTAINVLCDSGTPAAIGLVSGRFSVTLPDKCTTQAGSNAGIWAEVFVGPSANEAVSLGRSKIGAVPFAVEANHAISADTASGATTANALSRNAFKVEAATCVYDSSNGYEDCKCAQGETPVSAGICSGSCQPGVTLVESRPVQGDAWRLACENSSGTRVQCGPTPSIFCLKIN